MSRHIDAEWLLNFFVEFPDDYTLTIGNLRAVINDAPSVVSNRAEGEWKSEPDCGITRCIKCGWSIEECIEWNYCPNCGAKMKG